MLLVIVSETSATSTLKMFGSSEGTTKMLLLGLLVLLYCTCYYSLSRAVKDIPVGLAYATWSGTGILVVSTLGMAFYGQHPDTAAMIGMAVIASGIVKVYDLVVAQTSGGPGIASEVPAKYVYDYMFQAQNLGQGFAASTMMLITVAIIIVPWAYLEFGGGRKRV